jgi:HAD superfamily phosphatase (TIGR01668 family)
MLKRLRPNLTVQNLEDVDCLGLWTLGIRALLMDLDNTLVSWNAHELEPETRNWLEHAQKSGLALCMVSNATSERLSKVLAGLDIPFVHEARKPRRSGFRRGLKLLGVDPSESAIIGDQLFTDVLGGNRLGLFTIFVSHYGAAEQWWMKGVRRLENWVLQEHQPNRHLHKSLRGLGHGQLRAATHPHSQLDGLLRPPSDTPDLFRPEDPSESPIA